MDTGLIIGLSVWGACGFAAYGLTLAEYQKKFLVISRDHKASDVRFSLLMGLAGPAGLFAHFMTSWGEPSYGFRLLPLSKDEWADLARKEYGQWIVDEEFGA